MDDTVQAVLFWAAVAFGGIIASMAATVVYHVYIKGKPEASDVELPNGMKVRQYNPSETDWLFKEIFTDGTYASMTDMDGVEVELTFKPGMNVVDVGGNIGMFALYAWHRCGGDATIHSFEPMPAIHDVLAENCRRMEEGSITAAAKPGRATVVPHRVACSVEAGEIEFQFHPYMSLWSTLDAGFDEARRDHMDGEAPLLSRSIIPDFLAFLRPLGEFVARLYLGAVSRTETVKARTARLSDELKGLEGRIDLLKVDVEGAEMAVLGGISDADWARVDQVAMEVESVANRDAAVAMLEKHGLKAHTAPVIILEGTTEPRVWNIVAVRE